MTQDLWVGGWGIIDVWLCALQITNPGSNMTCLTTSWPKHGWFPKCPVLITADRANVYFELASIKQQLNDEVGEGIQMTLASVLRCTLGFVCGGLFYRMGCALGQ